MAYEGWALVEQMGFRQTVGRVCEVELYGTKMLQLDVPVNDGASWATRFCGGPSIYQVTPLSEEVALDMAKKQADPRPVKPTTYRIPASKPLSDEGGSSAADLDDERLF